MDKDIITEKDIGTLLKESRKLSPGETIIGSLSNTIIHKSTGEPKVIATFKEESRTRNFSLIKGVISDSKGKVFNISGEIYDDTIETTRPSKYQLNRSFFKKLQRVIKIFLLNAYGIGKRAYFYDSEGKVFIKDEDGNSYYVDSFNMGCMDANGDYFSFIKRKGKHLLMYRPEVDTTNFDYMFIDKLKSSLEEEKENSEELEPITTSPFKEEEKSKVIDITPFIRR